MDTMKIEITKATDNFNAKYRPAWRAAIAAWNNLSSVGQIEIDRRVQKANLLLRNIAREDQRLQANRTEAKRLKGVVNRLLLAGGTIAAVIVGSFVAEFPPPGWLESVIVLAGVLWAFWFVRSEYYRLQCSTEVNDALQKLEDAVAEYYGLSKVELRMPQIVAISTDVSGVLVDQEVDRVFTQRNIVSCRTLVGIVRTVAVLDGGARDETDALWRFDDLFPGHLDPVWDRD